jgi:hypothetical protein
VEAICGAKRAEEVRAAVRGRRISPGAAIETIGEDRTTTSTNFIWRIYLRINGAEFVFFKNIKKHIKKYFKKHKTRTVNPYINPPQKYNNNIIILLIIII